VFAVGIYGGYLRKVLGMSRRTTPEYYNCDFSCWTSSAHASILLYTVTRGRFHRGNTYSPTLHIAPPDGVAGLTACGVLNPQRVVNATFIIQGGGTDICPLCAAALSGRDASSNTRRTPHLKIV
jgi:hypothetical protein